MFIICAIVHKELNSYWVAKFMKDCIMLRHTVRLGHPFHSLKKNCVVYLTI